MTTEHAGPPAGETPRGEVIIGLDVGTTATKAVAFEIGSSWRRTAIREYPLLAPQPGWQVQEPAAITDAVLGALAECSSAVGEARVVAIAVGTAMHGLIALDGGLEPLTPMITWADARSIAQARELRASGMARTVYQTSGTPVHPMTPLTKLMWFSRNEPDLTRRARWWAGLKDLVLTTLTGTVVTELSSASGTAMLDLTTRDWSSALIDLAGISRDQLPPIVSTTTQLALSPEAARRLGLPAGLPVIAGAGDGPLGNLGTGAMAPGVVGLSLGTSGALRMLVPEPVLDPDGRLFCYALTDTQWIVGGAVSNGGIVVRWAGDVFGHGLAPEGRHPDAELLALAQDIPPGSDGLLMLPYLLPERAPLWDPDLAGAFLGIRHGHTRGHFVRAAVEGIALQLSTILQALDGIEPVTSVRATGGVFRSALWRSVMAAALARPVTVTDGAEGGALGVAALGLLALGRTDDLMSAVAILSPTSPGAAGAAGAGGTAGTAEVTEVATPTDIAFYTELRASVPRLLAAYDEIGRLFAHP